MSARPIREIVRELENRVQVLLDNFKVHYDNIMHMNAVEINIELESDPRCVKELEAMIAIFHELKPVERIVRFKNPEYTDIFTQLAKIEFERQNGKFFSFLAVMPSFEKKRGPKPKNVKLLGTVPLGQTSLDS